MAATPQVAIVGAGPAGKAAARELVKRELSVVLFEKEASSGGLMRFGYPSFRMPSAISERDARSLADLGIETKTGQELGRNLQLDELTRDYGAVLLTVGAPVPRRLGVSGENLTGVYDALSFLYASRIEQPLPIGRRVLVIGGGDTSVDGATTALQLGAKESVIVYRGTAEKLPAQATEVRFAKAQGVAFRFGTTVTKIERDDADRLTVHFADGSTEAFDIVIVAVGQELDASFLTALGLKIHPDGSTNQPKVFIAGGTLYGSNRLSHAILDGRRAAARIAEYLS